MKKKFLEIVGNASTTASYEGVRVGHAVNVTAYTQGDDVVLLVESNMTRVKRIPERIMTREQYDDFCDKNRSQLAFHALHLMGCTTCLHKDIDE